MTTRRTGQSGGHQPTVTASTLALVTILAASGSAFAQEPRRASQEGGLSLREAIARALDREPGFRADRTEADVARGGLTQAGLKPNPMVSLARQQQPGGMDNQTMVTVEWPLDLFRTAGRVAVAGRELDATQFRIADRARLLVAEVRGAYGRAAAARRDLGILEDSVTAARRQYEVVRGRVDEGAAPPIERDLLAVELRRLDADRLMQAARADTALVALKRSIGLSPTDPLALSDELESLVDAARDPPSGAGGGARPERPDVKEAEARVAVAAAAVDSARRSGRFDVSLFGTYTRMRTEFPQRGFAPGGGLEPVGDVFHYLAAGATVTMPLRNNNRGDVTAAQAQRAGAEARREAAALQARTEVAMATILDARTRAAAALYANDVRPLARANIDVVRQTYELGRGTVSDVLAEQRRYLDIERAYTDALAQAYEARTNLLSALGVDR